MKHEYIYEGPVYAFDTMVERNWKAATWAESEKQARNNMTYQYKEDTNRARNAKIKLTGKITMVE